MLEVSHSIGGSSSGDIPAGSAVFASSVRLVGFSDDCRARWNTLLEGDLK